MNIKELNEDNKNIDLKIKELQEQKTSNLNKMASMFENPKNGMNRQEIDGFKASLEIRKTLRLNKKDLENFKKVFELIPGAVLPVKIKETETLDTAGFKWYQNTFPEVAAEASKFLAESESIKVEVEEQ